MKAPLPADERLRLEALRNYEVLDTPAEQAFDDLTLLAAHICQVPTAMVSLVDENRQWFKSRLGTTKEETTRDIAFCAHSILRPDQVTEVHDARTDPRFADNPLVTADPYFRFYAGAPLVSPTGHALGALCVMDAKPHTLTPEQLAALQALSRRVVAQLELHRQARELTAREAESGRMLLLAEKSRRALLSVLEDEKLTARHLRESEKRFRQMAENINEVFWMSDVAKKKISYISPRYEQIWGRPCADVYASVDSWINSLHPDDRERVLHAALTKQATGEYDETYRILRPDGVVRWIRDKAFPIKEPDGRVRLVVGVAEDITDRKQLEEQFLHAQRMEAIGALASGVAHDLNNILAPILIVAGLLKETAITANDREMLSMIEQSGHRGAGIVRQLLTFSRANVGAERITVQPKHLVHDMTQIMRETFPRNITIVESVPRDLRMVTADPTQLHQVIMNLCVNARDAMSQGGTLTLEGSNVDVGAESPVDPSLPPGAYIRLKVEDTGHGIPPAIIHRIFEPFFTTKDIGKGTGLGLSTAFGIVKSHGGVMHVRSEPGRGTAFLVYLPAAAEPDAVVVTETLPSRGHGHKELILVVDDEASIREALRSLLELQGYRVLTAESGEDAIKACIRHQGAIRLVVTDMMMPGMDGLDLIRALRVLHPSIRIIASSGLDQAMNRAELNSLGVAELVDKPFTPVLILNAVAHALGQ